MKSAFGAFVLLALLFFLSQASFASNLASDSAGNTNYDFGWNTSAGGSGFGPWTLSSVGGSFTMADSTLNGGGSSLGINSPTMPPRAWGIYSGSLPGASDARRSFTGGALSIGQTFSIDMDNGFVNPGFTVACGFYNFGPTPLWSFMYYGGQDTYFLFDGSGSHITTLPFTTDGLHIDFTLTGAATYTATITEQDGPSQAFGGSLYANFGTSVIGFNADCESQDGLFFNNMTIIPEPTTMTLVGLSLLAALGIRRSKW